MLTVDLNADVGESFGAYRLGSDGALLRCVTSANIACGFHAGDPVVMQETVRLAKDAGAEIGAHPGYPDLAGFGRRKMTMSAAELRSAVIYQIGALEAFARAAGQRVRHVKLHGALYNVAAADGQLTREICEAIRSAWPDLLFFGLSGSVMLQAAETAGLRTVSEVFADRAYNDDGTLAPRTVPGAVLHDPEEAARRVLAMVKDGYAVSVNGKRIPVSAQSVCVHGDTAEAIAMAAAVRSALERENIRVRAFGED